MERQPTNVESVLPRPAEPLPTPALSAATRKFAEKLRDFAGLSEDAALALALAVVDPSAARRAAESAERLPVPGGIVIALRTEVWSRFVIPDPRNPRIGPARRHAVSNLIGRDESTRFRPLLEPDTAPGGRPELVQNVKNPEHLAWSAQQARDYILSHNDWRDSIRNQGVMTEVWVVATTLQHDDGRSVTVPATAEGSSRVTAVHDILDVRSADVAYTRDERKFRSHIRRLNEMLTAAGTPEQLDPEVATVMRCEKIPALLLIGFEPHGGIDSDFGAAVKSLVALRHVDYPKPWGEATENEALGDAVIAELERRRVITRGKADWLAGALTPDEARDAGFSADPAIRAAKIVRLFTDQDRNVHEAVRAAITSQSTRKNITTKFLLDVATSLILRSLPEEDARRRERTRKYLKEAYGVDLAKEWQATFRSPVELTAEALVEVTAGAPGPATRELAARSAYPLVVDGALTGDRGTVNSDQPDRRKPGEVIDRMRETQHGIYQLRQALTDFTDGQRIRMVDEHGHVQRSNDGRPVVARDPDLRRTFYAVGDGPAPVVAPTTPAEILNNALSALGQAIREVDTAVKEVEAVQADDGTPAIDSFGADRGDCEAWRNMLLDVLEKLPVWKRRSVQRIGSAPEDVGEDVDLDVDESDLDDVDFEDVGEGVAQIDDLVAHGVADKEDANI